MNSFRKILNKVKLANLYFRKGKEISTNHLHREGNRKSLIEKGKNPGRAEVINYLLSIAETDTTYLEIGVRNPEDNFNRIRATIKYSVDPGVEFKKNPVDFKLTSDEFFEKLSRNEILSSTIKFDVIFIDGLHYSEQAYRDIQNALKFIKDKGFIVIHDCNPPTEWHTRSNYGYYHSPAGKYWNGTTWKAFLKSRFDQGIYSCCIDTDWGLGVLSKSHKIGKAIPETNEFMEYQELEKNRQYLLNLISFKDFSNKLEGGKIP